MKGKKEGKFISRSKTWGVLLADKKGAGGPIGWVALQLLTISVEGCAKKLVPREEK